MTLTLREMSSMGQAAKLLQLQSEMEWLRRELKSINHRLGENPPYPIAGIQQVNERFVRIESELRQKARADTTNEAKQLAKNALDLAETANKRVRDTQAAMGAAWNNNFTAINKFCASVNQRLADMEASLVLPGVTLDELKAHDTRRDGWRDGSLSMAAAESATQVNADDELQQYTVEQLTKMLTPEPPQVSIKAAHELARQTGIYALFLKNCYGADHAEVEPVVSPTGGIAALVYGKDETGKPNAPAYLLDIAADGSVAHATGFKDYFAAKGALAEATNE